MAVFPEDMERLDPNDVKRSLEIMERYIRYMKERIEFAMSSSPVKLSTVAEYHSRVGAAVAVLAEEPDRARGRAAEPLSGIEVTTSVAAALARERALKEMEGEGDNGTEEKE